MYEYDRGEYPQLSLLQEGPERASFMPELKVPRLPHGTIARGDGRLVLFKFDLDRYPALVRMLNRYPAQSLTEFVMTEIDKWHDNATNHRYISKRYDLSYKPAHIVEGIQLSMSLPSAMHHLIRRAVRLNAYTASALIRVLVERRLDELQAIHGP